MMVTCSTEGCPRARVARGKCSTHYNQTLSTRHRSETVKCAWFLCDALVLRQRGRGARRPTCSNDCRRKLTFGWSEQLPSDHWARMWGATCALYCYSCAWCGRVGASRNPRLHCSEACRQRNREARRRGAEKSAEGSYTGSELEALWLRFGRACAYCHLQISLAETQAEHVIPLTRGGANDRTNLLPACAACNSDKCDQTPAEWAAERRRLGKGELFTALDTPQHNHLLLHEPMGSPWRAQFAA